MSRTSTRHRWPDVPSEAVAPSILRRYVTGDRLTVARFELKKDGVVPRHSHANEQFTCVLRGALRFDIDGRQVVVRQDEVLQIPGGVEHGVTVLEDAVVIDVFNPVRQDWIDKTDDYFRR